MQLVAASSGLEGVVSIVYFILYVTCLQLWDKKLTTPESLVVHWKHHLVLIQCR